MISELDKYSFEHIFSKEELLIHGHEKLLVRLARGHFVEQEFHRIDLVERLQHLAKDPNLVQLFVVKQQLLFSCSGLIHIHTGEDPLFHKLAVEMNFHIARPLKLFENDLIHSAAGVYESRFL